MIPGLTLHEALLHPVMQALAATRCNALLDGSKETDGVTGRARIIRFGWDYSSPPKPAAPVPKWLDFLLADTRVAGIPFNAVTINEYLPGQVIQPHKDSAFFSPTVLVLSLLSNAVIRFTRENQPPVNFLLKPGSLLVMEGEARNDWLHEILPVQKRRLSIVFRRFEDDASRP